MLISNQLTTQAQVGNLGTVQVSQGDQVRAALGARVDSESRSAQQVAQSNQSSLRNLSISDDTNRALRQVGGVVAGYQAQKQTLAKLKDQTVSVADQIRNYVESEATVTTDGIKERFSEDLAKFAQRQAEFQARPDYHASSSSFERLSETYVRDSSANGALNGGALLREQRNTERLSPLQKPETQTVSQRSDDLTPEKVFPKPSVDAILFGFDTVKISVDDKPQDQILERLGQYQKALEATETRLDANLQNTIERELSAISSALGFKSANSIAKPESPLLVDAFAPVYEVDGNAQAPAQNTAPAQRAQALYQGQANVSYEQVAALLS